MDDTHGLRRTYQHGCRCDACTAANRAYSTRYRQAHRVGRPPLGTHVPGTEAARVIAALLEEGYLKAEIATWLGHRCRVLHFSDGVTLRTTLKLRRLQRLIS